MEGDVGKSISSRKGEEGELLREDKLETEGVVEDETAKVDLHVREVEGDGETECCSNSEHRRRTFKSLLNSTLKSWISRHMHSDVNSTEPPASIAAGIVAERQGKYTPVLI